jgi:hypothetical protein
MALKFWMIDEKHHHSCSNQLMNLLAKGTLAPMQL